MRFNPDAAFDSLFIADRLGRERGSFTGGEIHLFGYLACLLWLYKRRPVSDWRYPFVGTELGAPYSQDIDMSIKGLTERGCFVGIQERLRMTDTGRAILRDLAGLSLNQERAECLNAACASTAAFSAGMVGSALTEEPELRRARALPMSRQLLEESAQSQLYLQFEALRGALRQVGDDLRVPAVVWLEALYRSGESIKTT
jgi:hypothetical protein